MTNEELDELERAANAAWPKSRALSIGIVEHIDHGVNGYQTTTRHETFNSDVILTLIAAARENAALRERPADVNEAIERYRIGICRSHDYTVIADWLLAIIGTGERT